LSNNNKKKNTTEIYPKFFTIRHRGGLGTRAPLVRATAGGMEPALTGYGTSKQARRRFLFHGGASSS
jgi:hypothetical protein